jgi:AraC-like DNA-binding protein
VQALLQVLEGGEPALSGCARRSRLHDSALLSVDLWRCDVDGDGLPAERCHATPVLTVALAGASVLQVGGRALLVESGTALFAHADLPYRSAHPFGCGDTGCHVRPSPLLLRELRLPPGWATLALAPPAYLRFRSAVQRAARADGDGLELEEACQFLLAAAPGLRVLEAEDGARRRHVELVEETKSLLLRRFKHRLSLDAIARGVAASPYHLARLFRRHTGFSLHGYRTRLRLLYALERLDQARGALTELALELGFSSQSHFTDAFRRAFGVPPGAVARGSARVSGCAVRRTDPSRSS